ncbi:MAG: beta-lactamase family protein [Hyphomicrobiaceae bacterium]|nr:beta-lactamase family protein [Hyphomicrobiaceae bacterium]
MKTKIKFATAAATAAVGILLAATPPAKSADPTASDLGIMQGFVPPKDKFVDSSNWNVYPLNRWSFQHMRRYMPTAPMSMNPATVVPFEKTPRDLGDIKVKLGKSEARTVTDIMESWQTDSLVVLHNGVLVYERYWNGMTSKQPHWVASVSKSYIGTAAAMLIERGVLDREATVASYVPELADSGFGKATVGQILDMTAGTDWDESPPAWADPNSPARQYGAATGSLIKPGEPSIGVSGFLPTIKQSRPHGEIFVYNSPQVDVMGWILTNVTGLSLDKLIDREIWSKLGTECEAYYMLDGRGQPFATGGLSICARDMARFGQMMLNGGHLNGQRIVPDNVIKKIRTLGSTEAFAKGPRASTYPKGAYRDYWWITNDDDGAYLAKGVFGQLIYINPRARVVIARHGSEKEPSSAQRNHEVETAFQAVADYLSK